MKKGIIFFTAMAIFSLIMSFAIPAHFLEEEAGISAYINAGKNLNLTTVKPLFKIIERDTADYVVGSISIPDLKCGEGYYYPETEDAHVYVSKDGWVVAYYKADEPTSKIIDWRSYEGAAITSTKLQLAIKRVSDVTGYWLIDPANIKYYHFVCPQANKLLIALDREDEYTTDEFDILIPNGITVCERSWALYGQGSNSSTFYIDDLPKCSLAPWDSFIPTCPSDSKKWDLCHGKLVPAQLSQGSYHKIKVSNSEIYGHYGWTAGGIALVYYQP